MKRAFSMIGLMLALCACEHDLYSKLSEKEANEMIAVLAEESIPASKAPGDDKDWKVRIDESDTALALEVLRSHGLPRERLKNLGDMFQRQGLVATPAEERMRYIYAISQELSGTLLNIDGVVAADVHVVIPENDPLSDTIRPSSAAVFIKHRADVDLSILTPMVKDLVAHSIEGLSHERVSLSLTEARQSGRDRIEAKRKLRTYMQSAAMTSRGWLWSGIAVLVVAIAAALAGLRGREGGLMKGLFRSRARPQGGSGK
jgi:type III secretion protein J